jgi:hypothetical protein
MNYIITEEQNQRLIDSIVEYFDNNLTPHDGWETPSGYAKALKIGREIFLFINNPYDDNQINNDARHMWYTTDKNPYATVPKEDSPIVTLPDDVYDSLTSYFGDLWKPIFKQWFFKNTELPVNKVGKL